MQVFRSPTGLRSTVDGLKGLTGELRDPEQERQFRLWRYDTAMPHYRLAAWMMTAMVIPFFFQIWRNWGWTDEFFILGSARLVLFATSTVALIWCYQRRPYQHLDRVFALCLYLLLGVTGIAALLAQDNSVLIAIHMLMIVTVAYILFPGRLIHVLGPLLIFSGVFSYLVVFEFPILDSAKSGLVIWAVVVNSVGFIAARQFQIFRRKEYLALAEMDAQATQLERARVEAVQAKEEAEDANRAKSAMLANTSHELRTPLNAILGFSEMIESQMLGPVGNPRYTSYAADIHRSGRHLLSLIDDLLDLSKVEAGKTELHAEWLVADDVNTSVYSLCQARARDKQQRIVFQVPDACPELLADARAVTQMLTNLISNAVKFSAAGEVITIRWCPLADGGLNLTVEDNGVGIDPTVVQRIMRPFEQVETDPRKPREGWGLGLALTSALAKLHQADFTLLPGHSGGTIGQIHFPPDRVRATLDQTVPMGNAV